MQNKNVDYTLLITARGGNQESVCALTELAREDVLAYLIRLTLDIHVAEDICQETIMQMLKSLPKLELTSEKFFWAWLYKTAFSKVSRHFRSQGNTRLHNHTTADCRFLSQIPSRGAGGPEALMQKEHATAITEALNKIKLKYRNILTLRCFQDLSYSEIALATGGTELQARLLFFRAKRSLRHQLASRGFKTKEHLLPLLSLFAMLTAGQTKAASASAGIKAASLHVSATSTVLGMATTKVGIAAIVTVCIIGIAASRFLLTSDGNALQGITGSVNNPDTTLLDYWESPDFSRPTALSKRSEGLLWADHATQGPAEPATDVHLQELLFDKSQSDQRVVVLPADQIVSVQFQQPIVDGPGPDIIIAGWSEPGPRVEIMNTELGLSLTLINPVEVRDALGRILLGYDLAELPQAFPAPTVGTIGTHNQGPQQGYELHEVRARQK